MLNKRHFGQWVKVKALEDDSFLAPELACVERNPKAYLLLHKENHRGILR